MVIIGAGGFAKELLQVILQKTPIEQVACDADAGTDPQPMLIPRDGQR